jgi:hypothetical protein
LSNKVFHGLLDDSFIVPLSDLVCIDVCSPSLENNKPSFSLIAVGSIACTVHISHV